MNKTRAFTLCLIAGALSAQNSQPRFENDYVIIDEPHPSVDVPGYDHKAHQHKLNRVMIYMHTGGEYLHYLADGKTVDLKWQAGDIVWSPASGWHYSSIKTDNPPYTSPPPMIVDVGIKKPGDPAKAVSPALDALKVDPKHYKLEFENSQVRVLRVKIGPKESVPMHESALNRLVVYMTDVNVRRTLAGGSPEVVQGKAGEFAWQAPSKLKVENLSDKPFEAVIVEFRS